MDMADAAVRGNGKGKRGREGRIGRDQQEAVLNAGPVKAKSDELIALYKAAELSADALNAGIKAVAEESGFNASTIKTVIAAIANDRVTKKQREVTQLALLFEEVV